MDNLPYYDNNSKGKIAYISNYEGECLTPETPLKEVINSLIKNGPQNVFSDGKIVGYVDHDILLQFLSRKNEELERELDAIINFSADWIFISDGQGYALRANSSYEKEFGVKVVGKNVIELEKEGVFHPSVTKMVLENHKSHTIVQDTLKGKELLTTGCPVFNDDGSIFRVIVNIRDVSQLFELKQKLRETEILKNGYYYELIESGNYRNYTEELFINSDQMVNLVKYIHKFASSDSTVLISGESGVGKGLIAHLIHKLSTRKDKPFINVNCGAIPENLLESELFGYTGGAFTGADKKGKIGKIELANHGTLFLDEITELPFNLQVKLLHFVQEKAISRIGDDKKTNLDIRIIAATNRDINEMVSKKQFREDLFFRLNVIPIEIPPLRERVEDIEPLTNFFLDKLNKKYRCQKGLDAEAINYLKKYNWPGNVRELENLIERLVIIVDENLIRASHLPRHIIGDDCDNKAIKTENKFSTIELQPLEQAKQLLEKTILQKAASLCNSTYEIAKELNTSQPTIVRKMKKYSIKLNH
jgi:transcriptional regulator with PAS, ATPase and Fis domain